MTELWAILMVIFATMIGAVGGIMLKLGSKKFTFRTFLRNKYLLSGLFFYGLSAIFYVYALRAGDLSVLYPLAALTYVWIMLISKFYLDESFSKARLAGAFMIVLGVVLIGI